MMCKFTHQGSNLMFEPHAEKLPFSKLPFLHASNARTASKCFSKCQASRHRERSERWTKVEDSIPSFDVWLLFGPLSTLSCSPLRLCQEGDALEPQVLTPHPPLDECSCARACGGKRSSLGVEKNFVGKDEKVTVVLGVQWKRMLDHKIFGTKYAKWI